jgi:hypothetical protein
MKTGAIFALVRLRRAAAHPGAQFALRWLSGLLLLGGAWMMMPHGDLLAEGNPPAFLRGAAVMGAGWLLSWAVRRLPPLGFWVVALGARLILFPMDPGDDMWRYRWDGMVQNAGFNPYALAPESDELRPLRGEVWRNVQHQAITSIYPPITQLGFRLIEAAGLGFGGFKLAYLAADIAVCVILGRWWGRRRAAAWAWNPLVIYSFAGGGHFDSWFVLALVLAWRAAWRARGPATAAALWIGVAAAVKIVSAPLLAWGALRLWRGRGIRPAIAHLAWGAIPVALAIAAFALTTHGWPRPPGEFTNVARSAELIPAIFRGLFGPIFGINAPFAAMLLLALWPVFRRPSSFAVCAERYFMVFLAFAPMVHGWYFTWATPFAAATRNLGFRLVGASGFIYFWLQQRVQDGGPWIQPPWEKAAMWLPLLAGFAWTEWRRSRRGPHRARRSESSTGRFRKTVDASGASVR